MPKLTELPVASTRNDTDILYVSQSETSKQMTVGTLLANLKLSTIPLYANNYLATTGGLTTGAVYRTSTGELRIVV